MPHYIPPYIIFTLRPKGEPYIMKKTDNIIRIISIAAMFLLIVFVYTGRLLYLQVSGQDYYTMSTPAIYRTRTVPIQAQRGEIFDRNGVALVKNRYTYNISYDYSAMPKAQDEINAMLLDSWAIASRCSQSDALVEPKPTLEYNVYSGGITFSYPDSFEETVRGKRYFRLIDDMNLSDATIEEQADALMLRYGIRKTEKNPDTGKKETFYAYNYETAARLLETRLDMELSGFSGVQPYTFARDASLAFITSVEEKYSRGILVTVAAERDYMYPGYATHILGRVSGIPSDKAEYYTEKGYPLDAKVGASGVESAFEDYLRGIDGTLTITEDEFGNAVGMEVTKEPQAGHDVYLTLDINMQMRAENALAENIKQIRAEANPNKPLTGEDASAGALVVEDLASGDMLAMASYPTYNLATFSEDYAALSSDPTSPFLNRTLNGRYAPGSTFKIGVAVAALSEKTITKDTVINAQGEYRYYADSNFTPRCWLYLLSGQVHGPITVVEAIQESCNYFFYEVGRLLTIETMNDYCRHYGLGQPTGIELTESTGVLAGPEYRAENGLGQWSPGDTITAAIGQSDNLVTPVQIGNYISTILNKGTRRNVHLLSEVRTYNGQSVFKQKPSVADKIEISPDILATVKEGMKGVMDNGSAASVFKDYPISVGGKTGTAQVYTDKSDNGIMVAFAPFDDPKIVVTSVIEQASGGTDAGYCIRDIFDFYFDVGADADTDSADE